MKYHWRLIWLCLISPFIVNAQIDYDVIKPATDKLFIKDVIIHDKPGSVIEYGSILIEAGIIKQIGKSIQQPTDARLIKADSLHVYPAFIDALITLAVPVTFVR